MYSSNLSNYTGIFNTRVLISLFLFQTDAILTLVPANADQVSVEDNATNVRPIIGAIRISNVTLATAISLVPPANSVTEKPVSVYAEQE